MAVGSRHDPVLLNEILELVRPVAEDGVIVDATIGLGGHAEALVRRYPRARLIGIDRDRKALELANERLGPFGERVQLLEGRYEELIEILEGVGIGTIDAIVADLGVSSMQLDDAERGFSFRAEGPLDMRMGSEGPTAADLVNTLGERDLARILREWGEEPAAAKLARAIVKERSVSPILTTSRLSEVIRTVRKRRPHERIDPATLTFQAIRIAVNDELRGLGEFVEAAVSRLKIGGRIGVISFHSLEDRIIKRTFRRLEGQCTCPPEMPVCRCGATKVIEVLTRRPLEAGEDEVERNPRSRSAKLRVAEKVEPADASRMGRDARIKARGRGDKEQG